MDVNSSDQIGKPAINTSAEDPKENKENKNELPPILRPKFSKRHRRRRLNKKSKESVSKEDEGERNDEDEEKQKSPDKLSLERPSMEKPSAENADDPKDTRDPPKEREVEEPECRESETNLVFLEQQNSPTDVRNLPTPVITMENEKKRKGNSLDEDEKKKKDGSKRKRKGHKKRNGRRNSNRKQQSLEDLRKKKRVVTQKEFPSKETLPSPRHSTYVPLKMDKSSENIASKKSRASARATADSTRSVSLDGKKSQHQQAPPQQKSKFNNFFKSIFDKTKSWMRKSDDVAQPTKEMLFKSYVSPEYGHLASNDFQPDPTIYMPAPLGIDLEPRLKNPRCGMNDVFINNRPFWVHRTNEDVIPKCKLLAHNSLVAQHALNNSCFLKELPRRNFYDPKREVLEKLILVDRQIGVDPIEKGLKRVTSNTYFGTCQMYAYKNSVEGKRRMEEFDAKYSKDVAVDDKKSIYAAKIIFQNFPAKEESMDKTMTGPVLFSYTRKARPIPGKSREFKQNLHVAFEPTKRPSKHKEVQLVPVQSQEVLAKI